MKNGMAMIMAIAFLIIVATLLAFMLNLTAHTSSRTNHIYFNEQAKLLAKSATEFAMLAVSGHNRLVPASDCIQTIVSQYPAGPAPFFNINTTIRYIGVGNNGTCGTNSFVNNITTAQSQGTVLIDVFVRSIEANLNLGEAIVYHRRTLQKP